MLVFEKWRQSYWNQCLARIFCQDRQKIGHPKVRKSGKNSIFKFSTEQNASEKIKPSDKFSNFTDKLFKTNSEKKSSVKSFSTSVIEFSDYENGILMIALGYE